MDNQYVQGGDRLVDRVATIRKKLAIADVVGDIGAFLLRRTLNRFDEEVDPDGKRWKPLADSTLRRREYADASGKKMLVRTRTLRESIKIIKGGLGSTFTNTGAGLRIGIDASARTEDGKSVALYGKIQNQRRRFLGVGTQDVRDIDSMLRRRGDEAIG